MLHFIDVCVCVDIYLNDLTKSYAVPRLATMDRAYNPDSFCIGCDDTHTSVCFLGIFPPKCTNLSCEYSTPWHASKFGLCAVPAVMTSSATIRATLSPISDCFLGWSAQPLSHGRCA